MAALIISAEGAAVEVRTLLWTVPVGDSVVDDVGAGVVEETVVEELPEAVVELVDVVVEEAIAIEVALPAMSQVARPSKIENAMPLSVLPSNATLLAGTSRRTHWPAAGSGPMYWRLVVPFTP